MSLRSFMTQTASTQRHPAMDSDGQIGAATTNINSFLIMPLMVASGEGEKRIRQALGLEGSHVQLWRTYTEAHSHTDSSVTVNQLPDVERGDKLVVGSISYEVQWVESQPATSSFPATLYIYLTQDT